MDGRRASVAGSSAPKPRMTPMMWRREKCLIWKVACRTLHYCPHAAGLVTEGERPADGPLTKDLDVPSPEKSLPGGCTGPAGNGPLCVYNRAMAAWRASTRIAMDSTTSSRRLGRHWAQHWSHAAEGKAARIQRWRSYRLRAAFVF